MLLTYVSRDLTRLVWLHDARPTIARLVWAYREGFLDELRFQPGELLVAIALCDRSRCQHAAPDPFATAARHPHGWPPARTIRDAPGTVDGSRLTPPEPCSRGFADWRRGVTERSEARRADVRDGRQTA